MNYLSLYVFSSYIGEELIELHDLPTIMFFGDTIKMIPIIEGRFQITTLIVMQEIDQR